MLAPATAGGTITSAPCDENAARQVLRWRHAGATAVRTGTSWDPSYGFRLAFGNDTCPFGSAPLTARSCAAVTGVQGWFAPFSSSGNPVLGWLPPLVSNNYPVPRWTRFWIGRIVDEVGRSNCVADNGTSITLAACNFASTAQKWSIVPVVPCSLGGGTCDAPSCQTNAECMLLGFRSCSSQTNRCE
jgi:hypothetical protein